MSGMRAHLKPLAIGLLGAVLGFGAIYYTGKVHYYLKVVWATEKILTAQGMKF